MGKPSNAQKERKALREQILKGIVDTETQAEVSFFTEKTGARFALNVTLHDFQELMWNAGKDDYIKIHTFAWSGERNEKMQLFTTHIRKDQIVEYSEVTDDMWSRFITDAADRAMMQKMAAGVQGGIQGVG